VTLMADTPETRYAFNGEIALAYQVLGDGPLDLVFVPGFVSHLECGWEEPSYARFLRRLAAFSRLILFDKRGTGLSERLVSPPTLEQRMDDVRVVMDTAGSERAAVLGVSEGGAMAALLAATYPDRVSALILYGPTIKYAWAPDYPWGTKPEELESLDREWRQEWGSPLGLEWLAPSMTGDHRFRQWWARYLRLAGSPAIISTNRRMNMEIDVRSALPSIHVPALILNRAEDHDVPIEAARYAAGQIPGAKLVELPGEDHFWWVGDTDAVADEIEEFLTGARQVSEPDRVLATVLFTDIVDSTRRAAEIGDRRWRDLLGSHNAVLREVVGRFRGRAIKSTGDGFLATFDGPARALQAAFAIHEETGKLGIGVRAGLHTGEIELIGDDVGGIAVHIAARVLAQALPGEVWSSRTVKDLVVGSGFKFQERGIYELKGVPDEWRLFSVER
jgi:pimeloyl-ACP methyl ester carboxylesterase